jgi:hypothetical protein
MTLLGVAPAAGYAVEDQEATADRIDVRFVSGSGDGGGGDDAGGGGGNSGEGGGDDEGDDSGGDSGGGGGGEQRSELRLRLRDGQPVLECRD